jgi:hypothetical protein
MGKGFKTARLLFILCRSKRVAGVQGGGGAEVYLEYRHKQDELKSKLIA